jgi:hypothetical protein
MKAMLIEQAISHFAPSGKPGGTCVAANLRVRTFARERAHHQIAVLGDALAPDTVGTRPARVGPAGGLPPVAGAGGVQGKAEDVKGRGVDDAEGVHEVLHHRMVLVVCWHDAGCALIRGYARRRYPDGHHAWVLQMMTSAHARSYTHKH